MKSVRAGSAKIPRHWAIGFGKQPSIISRRALALIKNRRFAKLLSESRKAHVRETFDCFIKRIDARLRIRFQAEVLPELVDIEKRIRLRVLTIFPFEKITDNSRVALVARKAFDFKICIGRGLIGKVEALPVIRQVKPGETAGVRIIIVSVIIFKSSVTQGAKVIIHVGAGSHTSALPVIQVEFTVQLLC